VNEFVRLAASERRLYYEQAAARLGLPALSVEKDFWVCWSLRRLFGLPNWTGHLTFKGGTSLSKGWRLIERFSEDIDVVIDREVLGFAGPDDPQQAPSGKQRQKRLEALKAACQDRIHSELLPALRDVLLSSLGLEAEASVVEQAPPEEDPDQQTILFVYPSAIAIPSAYLRRVVKIELGARSDAEPSESPIVQPYVAEALPALFRDASFPVRAVAPRRTFWEKAFLLHEETFRPPGKPRRRLLARHYYDLWSLITKGVAEHALADPGLFDRVAEHRQAFFRYGWMDYTTYRPGAFRLTPPDSQLAAWKRDYDAMQGEMFFGQVPSFDEILRVVSGFEQRFNTAGGPCCGSVQLNA
jgi:hypothetical protein